MDIFVSTRVHHAQTLHDLLSLELQILSRKGLRVACRKWSPGHFQCRVVESRLFGRRDRGSFRQAIARAVAALIVKEWECFVGWKLLGEASWLDDRDWALVRLHLNGDRSPLGDYRDKAAERLVGYLDESTRLDVDGFVSFRLPDYLETVGEFASRILDDVLLEQENREFIDILKHFAQRQEQPLDTVHVVIFSGNRFRIYDDKMQVVTKSAEEAPTANEGEIRQEDLLISALIALAPRRVTIHGSCMSATYNTLAEVFPGALHKCSGCRYCPTQNQA